MAKTKVLVVEDDRPLAELLVYNLGKAGYEVFVARDGQDGLAQARLHLPEIVILDLMLPVMEGLQVCRQLRAEAATKDAAILMFTARSEESDELVGFSLGADDYVAKGGSLKVLVERVKALERRRSKRSGEEAGVVACLGVTVDRLRHRVTVQDRPVQLTRSEFRLLETLIRQPGRVFERSELIDAALGEDTLVMERTIDVHIRAVRRKLGPAAEFIQTVRGVGYSFREPEN